MLESEWYKHAALFIYRVGLVFSPFPGGSHLTQQPVVSSLSEYHVPELQK